MLKPCGNVPWSIIDIRTQKLFQVYGYRGCSGRPILYIFDEKMSDESTNEEAAPNLFLHNTFKIQFFGTCQPNRSHLNFTVHHLPFCIDPILEWLHLCENLLFAKIKIKKNPCKTAIKALNYIWSLINSSIYGFVGVLILF